MNRKERAEKLREVIIQESAKLFLRKGFHGATVAGIIDALGVSKGAFYWHFASKEELLNTIIDHYEKRFVDSVIAVVERIEDTAVRKMVQYQKLAANFAYDNRDLCMAFLTIAGEMVGSNTEAEKKIRAVYDKYLNFIKNLLQSAEQEGEVRDDLDIEMTARVIHAIQNGALLEWYINYDKIDSGLLVRTYGKILRGGVFKHVDESRESKP